MEKVFAVVDIGKTFGPAQSFPTFGSLVNVIVRNAMVVAGVVAFILLIITGFRFIVGGGDAKQAEQTRSSILYILVGLIVVAASVWIIQIVATLTGSTELKSLIR